MKLSDLRPCANCDGYLTGKDNRTPTWFVIRTSQALLNPRAFQETMGLTQYFGGHLGLAEVMGPSAEEVVVLMADKNAGRVEKPDTWKETELHICFDCAAGGKLNLCELLEKKREG